MNKLLFIDTNIYLDFYRIRNDVKGSFLEHIEAIKDRLIVTDQVEMEFKKNRQSAIIEGMSELKKPQKIQVPGILQNEEAAAELQTNQSRIEDNVKILKSHLNEIFGNPFSNDKVYQVLQNLFNKRQDIDLYRGHSERYSLQELAEKRFMLGYPPRKKKDTSMGDSINWEWLVYIAEKKKASIWIVSRDGDYGASHNNKGYLNDWLGEEFKARSNTHQEIVLCPTLSVALKEFNIPVTVEEEAEEQRIIEEKETAASSFTVTDSVSLTLVRICRECGSKFVVQKNETICPKCAKS